MTGIFTALSLMALVLSPLFIPIAVTVVHWIRTRRHTPPAREPAA